ncbi:HalOD1 output domain-containing protein [Halorussus halophilus]|uniref:HalOD1 output domain-containing protein n=1 Tax=Halorussus halophilus TaxID=2650975 RepID=UPI0017881011|nr:HalOD1 output domain-containing protein [Halorussus halophilus]
MTNQNSHSTQSDDSSDEACLQRTFNPETRRVSDVVVSSVASFTQTEPTELPALANFVDPDALNALFQTEAHNTSRLTEGEVRFEYNKYVVRVQSEGTVTLYQPSQNTTE